MFQNYKTCVLCDTKIAPTLRLCWRCYRDYKDVMESSWFIALEELQHTQDVIDLNEIYELSYDATTNPNGMQDKPELLLKRNVGRPPTKWTIVNKVLEIFDKNHADVEEGLAKKLSLRAISKEINYEVSFFIVRKILTRYRPKQYIHHISPKTTKKKKKL